MIEALDETIKQLLITEAGLSQPEIDISFDVPNRDWSKSISKPTINVYLHDIRENLELRPNKQWEYSRNQDGTITKSMLGRSFDLAYLITAWTNAVEDEHRLLWQVLANLMKFPQLPKSVLQGILRNQEAQPSARIAQPDGFLRNAADVWTALDNQLKPVLTYIITLSLDSNIIEESLKEVRNRTFRFYPPIAPGDNLPKAVERYSKLPAPIEDYLQIGGYVTNPAGKPVGGAEVRLIEQGLYVYTDQQGRYKFGNVVQHRPSYTFEIMAGGFKPLRLERNIPGQAPEYDFRLDEAETQAK